VDGNGGTWTMEISYAGGLMAWTGHADIQHVLVITLAGQVNHRYERTEDKG